MSTNEQWLSTIICYVQHIMSAYYAWAKSSSQDYVSIHIWLYVCMNSDWAQSSAIYYVSIMYYAWSQTSAHSLCRHTVQYYTVHEHKHLHICRLCPHIQFLLYYVCAYCMYFALSTRTFPWDQISDWIAHSIRWNTETVGWGDFTSHMLLNRFYSS